ncbi:site-specific integrase [Hyphomicrobium sp.]|uniref:tyrosine-type recombinase/integrase n=1 Tax=Hyphomicrobium sp. TaxID=82 RepID=UPI001DC513D0|nr:site-specific integrase [Hyphomicrobium sp.]MBY0560154.1 site-specific integrase [Hyphomicrobium sp.]
MPDPKTKPKKPRPKQAWEAKVYPSAKSSYWQYDFTYDGNRFHGSTKLEDKAEALEFVRLLREKAVDDAERLKATGNAPLTIDIAAGRYWDEVGQFHKGAADTERDLDRLVAYFGPDKRMDEISDAEVAKLVAWRRVQRRKLKEPKDGEPPVPIISPTTVNRSTTEVLKKLFTRAKLTWKYTFPKEPYWRAHWLKEPTERVRELHEHEEAAIAEKVREDYAPWLEFVHLSALRLNETLLKWSYVNWSTKLISVPDGKGGEPVTTPITPTIRALLWPLRGDNEEWVFTYICRRPREGQTKGKRYPITYQGAKTQWRRMAGRAKLKDFRLHDLRHDTATKLLRKTGNLRLVQRTLNHKRVTTTSRYAHVMNEDVSRALEDHAKSRTLFRTRKKKAA